MNVHLGGLEADVQEKLDRGGYASAAEVIPEATWPSSSGKQSPNA
jgi:hypothetical protein